MDYRGAGVGLERLCGRLARVLRARALSVAGQIIGRAARMGAGVEVGRSAPLPLDRPRRTVRDQCVRRAACVLSRVPVGRHAGVVFGRPRRTARDQGAGGTNGVAARSSGRRATRSPSRAGCCSIGSARRSSRRHDLSRMQRRGLKPGRWERRNGFPRH